MPVAGGQANEDRPLPIARDQVTTQPPLMAKMVEAPGLFF
jgi:protein-L-isoaspartate O-methyltransferase